MPCKRRSSVNSGAWLRRFDDVTGVEKSFVAKAKKERQCLFCHQNANSKGLAGAIVPPVRSLAETK